MEWNAPLLYESQDRDDTQNPDIGFYSRRSSSNGPGSGNIADFRNNKNKRSDNSNQNNRDLIETFQFEGIHNITGT